MNIWLAGMSLGESLGELAGLLLIFVFILFITYQATRWIARYSAGQTRSGKIRAVETYRLAPNRYLQIVEVAGRYLVLAVSKDQISFLIELSSEDLGSSSEDLGSSSEDLVPSSKELTPSSENLASNTEDVTSSTEDLVSSRKDPKSGQVFGGISFQEVLEKLTKNRHSNDKK